MASEVPLGPLPSASAPAREQIADALLEASDGLLGELLHMYPPLYFSGLRDAVLSVCKDWYEHKVCGHFDCDPTFGSVPSLSRYYCSSHLEYGEEGREDPVWEKLTTVLRRISAAERTASLRSASEGWKAGSLIKALVYDGQAEVANVLKDCNKTQVTEAVLYGLKEKMPVTDTFREILRTGSFLLPVAHAAALFDRVDVLQALGSVGLLLNTTDLLGRNVLMVMLSTAGASQNVVSYLLEHLSDMWSHVDVFGQTLWHYIARFAGPEMLDTVFPAPGPAIEKDVSASEQMSQFWQQDSSGTVPLTLACLRNPSPACVARWTRLALASLSGNSDSATRPTQELLQHLGGHADSLPTLLHACLMREGPDFVQALWDELSARGALTPELLSMKWGPWADSLLHLACRKGNLAAAKLLVGANCDLLSKNGCGLTAVHIAVQKDHMDCAILLLEELQTDSAVQKYVLDSTYPPLLQFGVVHNPGAALTLIGIGADPSWEDKHGWSALGLAWYLGLSQLATVLIKPSDREIRGCARGIFYPDSEKVLRGPSAGRKAFPVQVPDPLRLGRWRAFMKLGMDATVAGTMPQPAVQLRGNSSMAARGQARVRVRQVGAGDVAKVYTIALPLRHCDTERTLASLEAPTTSRHVYRSPTGPLADCMAFDASSIEDFRLQLDIYTDAPENLSSCPEVLGKRSCLHRVASAEFSPQLLSAGAARHSTGDGICTTRAPPDLPGSASDLGTPTAMRLQGQITLPLSAPDADGQSVGYVNLQFVLVRGYEPPGGSPDSPASSVSSSSGWETPRLVGHRGSGADNASVVELGHSRSHRTSILENTLLSLTEAAKAGAELVEFDVMLSRDGVPVIHHDWGVKLAGGKNIRIPVSHLTVEQFLALPPQFMSNDKGTDEYSIAKAADAALCSRFIAHVRERMRAQKAQGIGGALAVSPGGVALKQRPPLPPKPSSNRVARVVRELGLEAESVSVDRLASSLALSDTFTTLENILEGLPPATGMNIEVKYPTLDECVMYGFRAPERNMLLERILDVVLPLAGQRQIIFSSFDPDICLMLSLKQSRYPVFLLTEGGTPAVPAGDPRMNSLLAATGFARQSFLFGIVTDVKPLVAAPSIIDVIQTEAGLVLCSYGKLNNDPDLVKMQFNHHIGAVIADHVAHIARTLRATPML